MASNRNLSNLTVIYDNNKSHERGLQIINPAEKFKSFGCDVIAVNGHGLNELQAAIKMPSSAVKVIVANTVKGCGSKTMICNQYEWHRRSPNEEEFNTLIKEIDEKTI